MKLVKFSRTLSALSALFFLLTLNFSNCHGFRDDTHQNERDQNLDPFNVNPGQTPSLAKSKVSPQTIESKKLSGPKIIVEPTKKTLSKRQKKQMSLIASLLGFGYTTSSSPQIERKKEQTPSKRDQKLRGKDRLFGRQRSRYRHRGGVKKEGKKLWR